MGNENQMGPPDERKAWTEPRLVRLGIDLQDVEGAKNPTAPQETVDHNPPS